jgi:hypothetical protein
LEIVMKAFDLFSSLAVTLLLGSSIAVAAPKKSGPVALRQSLKEAVVNAKSPSIKAQRSQCVNLEGTWKGSCVDSDNDTYDDDVVIDQSECGHVSIWGLDLPIGGVAQIGSVSPNWADQGSVFPDWNAAGNVLRLRVSWAARELGTDTFFWNVYADEDIQIVNGQLIVRTIQTNSSDINGQHSQGQYWSTCTYDKQPDAAH